MSLVNLSRKAGETELSYIKRLGEAKEAGLIEMTWAELANVFNKNLREPGVEWGESAYRKKFASMKQFGEEFGSTINDLNTAEELIELRRELEKEKVKVRDERNEYRKLIRDEARKESYQEQFIRSIRNAAGMYALDYTFDDRVDVVSDTDLLIPLTDIHAGIEIHNFWNDYDEDVLKCRLEHYLDRIFEIQERHNAQDAYVVCSEILSGIIHPNLRIQNNQDLIDQFLMVTDYICDFLDKLSRKFNSVYVYVAPGNHSRINAKKEQDLAHENMDNLLIPFISARMQNYPNVKCEDNKYEQGVALFSVRGLNVAAVHGDKDPFDKVVDRLSKMLQVHIDLILIGHLHTNKFYTDADVKIVQSGCLSGSDEFAINHRLRNRPEQAVCVISEQEGLDCIYDIKF